MPWDSTINTKALKAAQRKYDAANPKKDKPKPSSSTPSHVTPQNLTGSSGIAKLKGMDLAKVKAGAARRAAASKAKDAAQQTKARTTGMTGFGPGGTTVKSAPAGSSSSSPSSDIERRNRAAKAKAAAERSSAAKAGDLGNMRRSQKIKEGRFKGKYYGRDEFKGDLKKIDAWKKAGKPDVKKFLSKS